MFPYIKKMETKKTPKNAKKYSCKKCAFECCKMSDYQRHITTRKHQMETLETKKTPKNDNIFQCDCGQVYKHRSGLWKHSKKCTFVNNSTEDNELDKTINKVEPEKKKSDKEEIEKLISKKIAEQQEENNKIFEQTNKILEKLSDNIGPNTINNINNINTINMNYNINVFLNDQCKDAINLIDFINNVQCQLKDLENVGKIGYVDGISKIFIENLSGMEVTKRPIHCTDLKRKSMYIKDNNEWKKDNNNNQVKKAINIITKKNIDNIDKWRSLNIKDAHDRNQSQYIGICNQSLVTDDNGKMKEKIIKNIGDTVALDKDVIKTTIEENTTNEIIE